MDFRTQHSREQNERARGQGWRPRRRRRCSRGWCGVPRDRAHRFGRRTTVHDHFLLVWLGMQSTLHRVRAGLSSQSGALKAAVVLNSLLGCRQWCARPLVCMCVSRDVAASGVLAAVAAISAECVCVLLHPSVAMSDSGAFAVPLPLRMRSPDGRLSHGRGRAQPTASPRRMRPTPPRR